MNITINIQDGVPIYRQIANQVRYMVASGILLPGEEISPVRSLALSLNVTPNTVVKAYEELEAVGVIFKRRGAGTYISNEQTPLADRERKRIVEARSDGLLAEAHQLDFSSTELLSLFTKRQSALHSAEDSNKKARQKHD